MSDCITAQLNAIAARWEHGHDQLTDGCALCIAEYDEIRQLLDTQPPTA
ncbi:hypothetical protein [Streptomyces sp. NPDC059176]